MPGESRKARRGQRPQSSFCRKRDIATALGRRQGKHLGRVQQPLGVEHVLHTPSAPQGPQVANWSDHQIALFDADTMFPGQTSAHLDTEPQDRPRRTLRSSSRSPSLIRIDTGSVGACCRHRHETRWPTSRPVFLGHLADPAQHIRQFRHRNRSVQTHVIVDLPHRAKGRFAPQPDPPGLGQHPAPARNIRPGLCRRAICSKCGAN